MSDVAVPILYGPQDGKSLSRLYPELERIPEISSLHKDDQYFAWLIGIKGSPISKELPENTRYLSAAVKCFPEKSIKRTTYLKWETMPDDIKKAIRVFEKFNPDLRLMAKAMAMETFENYQKLLRVDVDKDFTITKEITSGSGKDKVKESVTETDWSGRKSYVDSSTKIIEALPSLVKTLEEGFGITEKKNGEQVAPTKAIDVFHARNAERS